jgi:YccS/YhfK family integral membrane protein
LDDNWKLAWRRNRNHEGKTRGAQAFLALSCVLAFGWWVQWQAELMPVLLGVIASALTETDDNWRGRARVQLITLACFFVMASAVWATASRPGLLVGVMALSAFTLTLLGALSERYRAVAFGSLILFVYAALAANSSRANAAQTMPLMLAGATWYGVVSVLWTAAWPRPPVRHRLSQLYAMLGEYFRLKALMLEPVRDVDLEQRRMALALHNGRVVDALNAAKESLSCRLGPGQPPAWLQSAMHQYLAAQDLHERVNSSHEHYDLLSNAFFHSDALYRCQRVLTLMGEQALKLAVSIQQQSRPQHHGATARAIEDMQSAIHYQGAMAEVGQASRPLRSLRALGDNLAGMARVFAGAMLRPPGEVVDMALFDRQPRSWADAATRIRAQLDMASPWLRHALRLTLSLVIGFAAMQLSSDPHAYWILLTIVFVSQPQYAATLTRLMQRVQGTALGLALGWGLIQLFPAPWMQAALTVLAGAVFFGARQTRYVIATSAVTVLLLLSFHQMGMAQGVIPARLLDTVVGSSIAALAAWLILPNWQFRLWPLLAAQTLRAQASYLREALLQHQSGKSDHLVYRLARRNAHNADAALSKSYLAMLKEPARVRRHQAAVAVFLRLSHTLLNYLSALGAQRLDTVQVSMDHQTGEIARALLSALEDLAAQLGSRPLRPAGQAASASLTAALGARMTPPEAPIQNILQAQLQLAGRVFLELQAQAQQILEKPG